MLETVEIVKILPTRVWAEKDFFGTVRIKMQHEGMEAFDFIQIQYSYAYTGNSHQWALTKQILALLGVEWDGKYEAGPMPQIPAAPKEGA